MERVTKMTVLEQMGKNAKQAAVRLASASTREKDLALSKIADALLERQEEILEANEEDLQYGREIGLNAGLLDRLRLDEGRILGIAGGVRDVIALPDPIGKTLDGIHRPNGMEILKVRVPLGVIGIIYEARPNVTADAAALCLKSGNAVILRGGKEAIHSNKAIAGIMRDAVEAAGLPADCIALVEDVSRDSANEMMRLNAYIDVLIPRGGAGLIKAVVQNATVPVIETGTGNCHVYVDAFADIEMAKDIIVNAKVQRPSVCNACESIVVHQDIAKHALPPIVEALKNEGVEIRGDAQARRIVSSILEATEEDFSTEYLDLIISIKTVSSLEEAICHINETGTGHSEAIVTGNYANARRFLQGVDAAAVYVNASTRFTDGSEFGLGAEIGISTQKLHARGPMGLNELTSVKFMIYGDGQVR